MKLSRARWLAIACSVRAWHGSGVVTRGSSCRSSRRTALYHDHHHHSTSRSRWSSVAAGRTDAVVGGDPEHSSIYLGVIDNVLPEFLRYQQDWFFTLPLCSVEETFFPVNMLALHTRYTWKQKFVLEVKKLVNHHAGFCLR